MTWVRGVGRTVSVAGLLGFGMTSTTKTYSSDEIPYKITIERPEKKELVSRRIINAEDKTGLKLRLYQYESCPFCCKVRAFLDYYGFSYDVVEVNPVTKKQIDFSKDYKKVPVLRAFDSLALTESSLVVSQLATLLNRPDRTLEQVVDMYPAIDSTDLKGKPCKSYPNKYFVMMEDRTLSPAEMAFQREEREWREWVDDHFIHLISPNVYRSWEESLETFRQFEKTGEWHRNFDTVERYLAVYLGAAIMFAISKGLKKRHNITDERKAMEDACEKWVEALGNRKFMGGDQPSLADIALYGAMQSFAGCRAFNEVIAQGRIADWYGKMKCAVSRSEGRSLVAARKGA